MRYNIWQDQHHLTWQIRYKDGVTKGPYNTEQDAYLEAESWVYHTVEKFEIMCLDNFYFVNYNDSEHLWSGGWSTEEHALTAAKLSYINNLSSAVQHKLVNAKKCLSVWSDEVFTFKFADVMFFEHVKGNKDAGWVVFSNSRWNFEADCYETAAYYSKDLTLVINAWSKWHEHNQGDKS